MNLEETYQKIKPAIVAFVPKFHPVYDPKEPLPEFPPIFGTGFIIADGLVVTNDHVAKQINKLPRPKDCPPELWPVNCLLLYFIHDKGMAEIHIDVLGVFGIQKMDTGKAYYGPPKPDIAFVHIKMKDLPTAKVHYDKDKIKEGCEVATAGFPMGTATLTAPGYLHQLTPTLQRGIISAVLPFECDRPHALMINVMTQGGASGSPVFSPDSDEVIGVLYGGLIDKQTTLVKVPKNKKEIDPSLHAHYYKSPTNISYVVPSYYIEKMLPNIVKDKNLEASKDLPSLNDVIKNAQFVVRERGKKREHKIWRQEEMPVERKLKEIEPGKQDRSESGGDNNVTA
ncbi:MAG: trypsin-like peptidase domain-containing protein [Candidatus Omnitrophica bacterium]|nr:trypsin-like peptidase domain-containing protein [Candidatus Omnitrophota bacterium]